VQTFIDEAGIFSNPNHPDKHNVSVVGALTIPDHSYEAVRGLLKTIKKEWGVTEGEIKGKELGRQAALRHGAYTKQALFFYKEAMSLIRKSKDLLQSHS
jgi:hypothetical protein